jgi:hypothetical protein
VQIWPHQLQQIRSPLTTEVRRRGQSRWGRAAKFPSRKIAALSSSNAHTAVVPRSIIAESQKLFNASVSQRRKLQQDARQYLSLYVLGASIDEIDLPAVQGLYPTFWGGNTNANRFSDGVFELMMMDKQSALVDVVGYGICVDGVEATGSHESFLGVRVIFTDENFESQGVSP